MPITGGTIRDLGIARDEQDQFALESQRVVGEKHSKLLLVKDGRRLQAMRFNALDPLPPRFRAAYRLSVNEYQGVQGVQVSLEHVEGA